MSGESVLVECHDATGHLVWRERVRLDESRALTLGRSVEADLVVDEEHAAPIHVRLEIQADGQVLASDLGSVNGIVVDGRRMRGADRLALPGNTLRIGRTRIRLRTARDAIAPEKPENGVSVSLLRHPAVVAGVGGLVIVGHGILSLWVTSPRDLAGDAALLLGMLAAATLTWVAVWALVSRILVRDWRFVTHAAILLGLAALAGLADDLLDLGWFAFSLPAWSMRSTWITGLASAACLYLHLRAASQIGRRGALVTAALLSVVVFGAAAWFKDRNHDRDVNHVDNGVQIYPPALRLRAASDPEAVLKRATALSAAADARRRALPSDGSDDDD